MELEHILTVVPRLEINAALEAGGHGLGEWMSGPEAGLRVGRGGRG